MKLIKYHCTLSLQEVQINNHGLYLADRPYRLRLYRPLNTRMNTKEIRENWCLSWQRLFRRIPTVNENGIEFKEEYLFR